MKELLSFSKKDIHFSCRSRDERGEVRSVICVVQETNKPFLLKDFNFRTRKRKTHSFFFQELINSKNPDFEALPGGQLALAQRLEILGFFLGHGLSIKFKRGLNYVLEFVFIEKKNKKSVTFNCLYEINFIKK